MYLKRRCILLLLDGISYEYQLSLSGLMCQSLKVHVSLLTFYLNDLSIGVSGVLKALAITVSLLILPFMAVSICILY